VLEPRGLCTLRKPPFVPFEPPRLAVAACASPSSLVHAFATSARFQANPRRGFAAPPRLCLAPREFRPAPREFRRAPPRLSGAPRWPSPSRPRERVATSLRPRTAAPRSPRASARAHGERPQDLREPLPIASDASSPTSSSRPSLRADRPVRFADFPAASAAGTRPRASQATRAAPPLHRHGRPPHVPSGPPRLRSAALYSLARAARAERRATRISRRAAHFPRLARHFAGRSRSATRAAAASRLPFENTGRLAARPSRLSPSIETRFAHHERRSRREPQRAGGRRVSSPLAEWREGKTRTARRPGRAP
jgi:hypothetical protein